MKFFACLTSSLTSQDGAESNCIVLGLEKVPLLTSEMFGFILI